MENRIVEFGAERVLVLSARGALLAKAAHINDFLAEAWGVEVGTIAIPVSRLGPEFFRLRSRLAGEVVQKFVNYGLRLVVLGDVSGHVSDSEAFRDFVYEANAGRHLWFLSDEVSLAQKFGI